MRWGALAGLAAGACLFTACIFTGPRSSYTAVPKGAPAIARTAGDELLKYVPAGAQLVIEIDLARLYENPTIGAAATRAIAAPDASLIVPRVDAPLANARMVVLAAYDVTWRVVLRTRPGQP